MPHVSHDDILDDDRLIGALDTQFLAFGAGSQRLSRHRPSSIITDRRLGCLLSELYGHLAALVRPSPNVDRSITLKHHVVRENAR